MDRSEVFVEFLLEDLEFLLHTRSNSIAADEMELAMSLCEDLKFLISFLKGIPESLSTDEKIRLIRRKILHSFLDLVRSTTGMPEIGNRALVKRLTGGEQKELEVINRVVEEESRSDLYYDPAVGHHFDIVKWGAIYDRSRTLILLDLDEESLDALKVDALKERICKYLKGKRYLFDVSVRGGICSSGIWDDLKTCFPDDENGSKIVVSHHFNPFIPYYPFENEDAAHYFSFHHEDIEREFFSVIEVKYTAIKILQYAERMNIIKEKALEVLENQCPASITPKGESVFHILDTESDTPEAAQNIIVGFDDVELVLLNRLTGEKRELEVILIAGMAGIGKTTMARRLYKNPQTVHWFYVRAWASVSQVYQKGNVLHKLLLHLIHDKEYLSQMSDETMGVMLYKFLKGKKFLIVIDDIWDAGVWNDLKIYFPNDENGSKVLLTSRIKNVVVNDKNGCPPYCLRYLNEVESWYLFERKVFGCGSCPQELIEMGKNIVAKCKGLPLAIVVVSGLISKKEKSREWWKHLGENIGSFIDSDKEQFMNVLELSYKYLPLRLKSCFLYLGAFPEDYEIPVRKLLRMWIAEGFIQQMEGKKLEEIAENYLTNLVDRSLVIVSRRRSDGGIKACLIHDMLRKLCIRKAKETNFFLPDYGYQTCSSSPIATFSVSNLEYEKPLFNFFYRDIILDFYDAPSLKVFANQNEPFMCVLLRVLDLRCIIADKFPSEVLQLFRLNYLALYLETMTSLTPAICKLWNLQTLILDVQKGKKVTLPGEIWKMVKLRYLLISPEFEFEMPRPNSASPLVLDNLQTVSWLCPLGPTRDFLLARIPNVRNLGFHITLSSSEDPFNFYDLSSLIVLEKFKFEYPTYGMVPVTISSPAKFPPSLKKLTLIGGHINWEEMAIIGMLPNLEVLKVKDNFFSGPKLETCEGGFKRLKFLKFSHMDFQEWIATADDFPVLEKLVLNGCLKLAEIPSEMGNICTMQVIEVYRSSDTVADSARQIQESQRDWGNDEFKAFIYGHFQDHISRWSC